MEHVPPCPSFQIGEAAPWNLLIDDDDDDDRVDPMHQYVCLNCEHAAMVVSFDACHQKP